MSASPLHVGVIGAGSWGTALAIQLVRAGHDVVLWSHGADTAQEINEHHENRSYLEGIPLHRALRATTEMEQACVGKDMIVWVTPSHVTRQTLRIARPFLPRDVPIVIATKGIENDSLMTMSEVFEEELPLGYHAFLAYLSGPSFAREVGQNMPTTVVVAAFSERLAKEVQHSFNHGSFRVYRTMDVVGVEIGGSLKNVIAIAAGAADGMGFGHNARAGLITRGLAEISRLAVARGANPMTLAGLAGMGDLVLTCTGGLSRNRSVGIRLGRGEQIGAILNDMNMVAEGVKTARSVHDLAARMQVDMPICEEVYRVLYEEKAPADALRDLMGRELKRESFGF
jgi:glycerol-3-phosphate dehydrogenase (NAD(P)+)